MFTNTNSIWITPFCFCFQLILDDFSGAQVSLLALFLFKNMVLCLLMCGECFKENIPKLDSQLCFSKECSHLATFQDQPP